MSNGQILRVKQKRAAFPNVFINKADAQLALNLPKLRLPQMDIEARKAFCAVLDYEKPPSNGSLKDYLGLTEARGFSVHPSDWLPDYHYATGAGHHPELYQPWVDWLSENGLSPFHEGNSLTEENFDRWKPSPRQWAFKKLLRKNEQAAYDLLLNIGSSKPAAVRLQLLSEINAGGSFNGNYPSQVPILKAFLTDRSEKVRTTAKHMLKRMNGLETEEAHAAELAKHIKVSADRVAFRTPRESNTFPFWANFHCTTFNFLAVALGISSCDLARNSDLQDLGENFMSLAVRSGDTETRSIIASRLLEQGDDFSSGLFSGVARPLWERGLRATFDSHHYSSIRRFPDLETGTLTASQMRDLRCYKNLERSVTAELENGELPVNEVQDPLRAVALVIDKRAASEALNEAIVLGMKPSNPRLTMLKLNMAL